MKDTMSVEELCDIFLQVVNKFIAMDKLPQPYDSDALLHLSEIHIIDAIGKNENINITNLAKLQGITRGAVSQMIKKLVRKGVVMKSISPETENEVVLTLTRKGRDVFEKHRQYHAELNQKIADLLSEAPEDTIVCLGKLGCGLEKIFDEITENRTEVLKKDFLKND